MKVTKYSWGKNGSGGKGVRVDIGKFGVDVAGNRKIVGGTVNYGKRELRAEVTKDDVKRLGQATLRRVKGMAPRKSSW